MTFRFGWLVMALVLALGAPGVALAQDGRAELQAYLETISADFRDAPDRFAAHGIDPALVARSEQAKAARVAGEPRIIRHDARAGTATALLSGHYESGNTGTDTWLSLLYSGLYRLERTGARWRVLDRLPLDVNRIAAQRIEADLDPMHGLSVVDTLRIEVAGAAGFATALNRAARLSRVEIDGRPAEYVFQSGLLWVEAPVGVHDLTLAYDLEVERVQGGNSSAFTDHFGHVRNQYWWHPFHGFGSDATLADFDVSVRAPDRFHVALDMPQETSVADGVRTTRARSAGPTMAVTLAYDDAWSPRRLSVGGVTLDLFATEDYAPSAAEVEVGLARAWTLLADRFGTPALDRIAIIQGRARQGTGWHFFSNQAIVSGGTGGALTRVGGYPIRVFFGHEVAHLWTRPSGVATNFLGEGWATYTEALMLRAEHGPDVERQFWRDQARLFTTSDAAKATPLNADPTNNGVAYSKGSWVLAMLERAIGREAFDAGLRAYVARPRGQTDYEHFLAGFGADRARAERFLTPWVQHAGTPVFHVETGAGELVLMQDGPTYWLPDFDIRVIHADGSFEIRTIQIEGPRTVIGPVDDGVVEVELDPFGDYLLVGPLRQLAGDFRRG